MEKITKEQFIKAWKRACEDNTAQNSQFEIGGTKDEPYHSILIFNNPISVGNRINFDILLRFIGKDGTSSLNKYSCEARIVFDGFVEFQTLELEVDEYEEMLKLFEQASLSALMRRKKEIVEDRQKDLMYFLGEY